MSFFLSTFKCSVAKLCVNMAHTQVTGTKSVELGGVSYIRLKGEHKMNEGERVSQTCSSKGTEDVF